MSQTYTPDATNDPDTATIPDDGDDLTVASILSAVEAALDKIAHTQARQIPRVFSLVDFNLADLSLTDSNYDEDAVVICEAVKTGDVIVVDASWDWKHTGTNAVDVATLFRIDDADGTPDEDTIGPGGVGTALACTTYRLDNNTNTSRASLNGSYVVTADGDSRVSVRFRTGPGTLLIGRLNLRAMVWSEV